MRTKRFNPEDFERYDNPARVRTQQHLELTGYTVEPHPDRYAQDLIATKDGTSIYVECEVKTVWSGAVFPYDTLQLPERKSKFFNAPTLFFVWNKELSNALMFKSEDVKDLTPVEVPNKYIASGEMFYQIPLTLTGKVRMDRYETNT